MYLYRKLETQRALLRDSVQGDGEKSTRPMHAGKNVLYQSLIGSGGIGLKLFELTEINTTNNMQSGCRFSLAFARIIYNLFVMVVIVINLPHSLAYCIIANFVYFDKKVQHKV